MGKQSKNGSLAAGPRASQSYLDITKLLTNRTVIDIGGEAKDEAYGLRREECKQQTGG